MELNKIINTYLMLNNTLVNLFPNRKKQINTLFHSIRELTDNLVYESNKRNDNRFPYYKKNYRANSVLIKFKKIIKLCNQKVIKKEILFNELVDLYVQLKWFQWHISDARRSVNSILKILEKDLQNEKKNK